MLRRAMVHVLDNAAKFTPRGAEVAVGVWVAGAGDDARYRFVVADSGPGIDEAHRRRILDPFFQVDATPTREQGGVGIGLAFARHVAEALGGGIEVRSPPGMTVAGRTPSGTAVVLEVRALPPSERAR
jgi:signal transduction histidine kinase